MRISLGEEDLDRNCDKIESSRNAAVHKKVGTTEERNQKATAKVTRENGSDEDHESKKEEAEKTVSQVENDERKADDGNSVIYAKDRDGVDQDGSSNKRDIKPSSQKDQNLPCQSKQHQNISAKERDKSLQEGRSISRHAQQGAGDPKLETVDKKGLSESSKSVSTQEGDIAMQVISLGLEIKSNMLMSLSESEGSSDEDGEKQKPPTGSGKKGSKDDQRVEDQTFAHKNLQGSVEGSGLSIQPAAEASNGNKQNLKEKRPIRRKSKQDVSQSLESGSDSCGEWDRELDTEDARPGQVEGLGVEEQGEENKLMDSGDVASNVISAGEEPTINHTESESSVRKNGLEIPTLLKENSSDVKKENGVEVKEQKRVLSNSRNEGTFGLAGVDDNVRTKEIIMNAEKETDKVLRKDSDSTIELGSQDGDNVSSKKKIIHEKEIQESEDTDLKEESKGGSDKTNHASKLSFKEEAKNDTVGTSMKKEESKQTVGEKGKGEKGTDEAKSVKHEQVSREGGCGSSKTESLKNVSEEAKDYKYGSDQQARESRNGESIKKAVGVVGVPPSGAPQNRDKTAKTALEQLTGNLPTGDSLAPGMLKSGSVKSVKGEALLNRKVKKKLKSRDRAAISSPGPKDSGSTAAVMNQHQSPSRNRDALGPMISSILNSLPIITRVLSPIPRSPQRGEGLRRRADPVDDDDDDDDELSLPQQRTISPLSPPDVSSFLPPLSASDRTISPLPRTPVPPEERRQSVSPEEGASGISHFHAGLPEGAIVVRPQVGQSTQDGDTGRGSRKRKKSSRNLQEELNDSRVADGPNRGKAQKKMISDLSDRFSGEKQPNGNTGQGIDASNDPKDMTERHTRRVQRGKYIPGKAAKGGKEENNNDKCSTGTADPGKNVEDSKSESGGSTGTFELTKEVGKSQVEELTGIRRKRRLSRDVVGDKIEGEKDGPFADKKMKISQEELADTQKNTEEKSNESLSKESCLENRRTEDLGTVAAIIQETSVLNDSSLSVETSVSNSLVSPASDLGNSEMNDSHKGDRSASETVIPHCDIKGHHLESNLSMDMGYFKEPSVCEDGLVSPDTANGPPQRNASNEENPSASRTPVPQPEVGGDNFESSLSIDIGYFREVDTGKAMDPRPVEKSSTVDKSGGLKQKSSLAENTGTDAKESWAPYDKEKAFHVIPDQVEKEILENNTSANPKIISLSEVLDSMKRSSDYVAKVTAMFLDQNPVDLLPVQLAKVHTKNRSTNPVLSPDEEEIITALRLRNQEKPMASLLHCLTTLILSTTYREDEETRHLKRLTFCRVFAALCRLKGAFEQLRVLCFDLVTLRIQRWPELILCFASVWPASLTRIMMSDSEPFFTTLELLTWKAWVSEEKQDYRLAALWDCMKFTCRWGDPAVKDPEVLANSLCSIISDQDRIKFMKMDVPTSPLTPYYFEPLRALEMLAWTMGWKWTWGVAIQRVLWPIFMKLCRGVCEGRKQMSAPLCVCLKFFGALGRVEYQSNKETYELTETIGRLVTCVYISEVIQVHTVHALLRLAEVQPALTARILGKWKTNDVQLIKGDKKLWTNLTTFCKDCQLIEDTTFIARPDQEEPVSAVLSPKTSPGGGHTPGRGQTPMRGHTPGRGHTPMRGQTPMRGHTRGHTPGRGQTPLRGQTPGRAQTRGSGQGQMRGHTPMRGQTPGRGQTPIRGPMRGRGHTPRRGIPLGRGATSGRGQTLQRGHTPGRGRFRGGPRRGRPSRRGNL